MIIALLGPKNTYCDFALHKLRGFESCEKIYCRSIDGIFKSLLNGKADRGFVPVENSEAGLVSETKLRMASGKFKVIKTVSVPVSHCVATRKGVSREQVRKIFSHEQAFKQCEKFFKKTFPKARLMNVASTAAAMALVKKQKYVAAVGSPKTAEIYGLEVLYKNIQDAKNNKTSFALIGKETL